MDGWGQWYPVLYSFQILVVFVASPSLHTVIFPFRPSMKVFFILHPQAQVNKSTVLVSTDGCHMVIATNVCMERMA